MSVMESILASIGLGGGGVTTTIYCGHEMKIEAKGRDQDGPARFHAMAYNGGVLRVKGKDGKPMSVIIDMACAEFERPVTKVNRNHNQQREIGHTTAQKMHRGSEVYGIELGGLLSVQNDDTKEITAAASDGFPWDGSIEAKFDMARAQQVEAGQKVLVNGKTFEGPVIVAKRAIVNGFAILNTGADRDAKVSIAAELTEEELETLNKPVVLNATQIRIKALVSEGMSHEDIAAKTDRSVSFVADVEAGITNPPEKFVTDISSVTFVASQPLEDEVMSKELKDYLKAQGLENASLDQIKAAMGQVAQPAAAPAAAPAVTEPAQVAAAAVPAAAPVQVAASAVSPLTDTVLQARRDAYANEEARVREIEILCEHYDEPMFNTGTEAMPVLVTLRAHAVKEGWNTADTKIQAMHWKLGQNNSDAGPAIHSATQHDGSPSIVEAALCMTAGISEQDIKAHGFFDEKTMNEATSARFRGFKPSALGQQVIKNANMTIRAGQLDDTYIETLIRAERKNASRYEQIEASGFTTASFPGILRNVANKSLLVAYRRSPSCVPIIFRTSSASDFKPTYSYRFEPGGVMEQLGKDGEIKHGTVAENEYTKKVDTFAKMLTWTRQDMINDDLGALGRTMEMLGTMAFKARELAALRFILNPRAGFWNDTATAANPVVNSFAGNAFGIQGMTNSSQNFMGMEDDDGLPINITGGIVLTGSGLSVLGMQIKNDTEIRQEGGANARTYTTKNPHAGSFDCLATAWLNNEVVNADPNRETTWYRFADPNTTPAFEACYLNGVDTPTVESSETDFNTLGMAFRGYFDFGFGANDPRYAQRNLA